jgi:protein-S-isoprenylcysteine O-methyltransferase Ste14
MKKKVYTVPKSATLFAIGLAGVLVYFITIYFLRKFAVDTFWGAVISMGTVSLSMILLEKIYLQKEHRYSSGINFLKPNKINYNRVLIKLLGLYGTIGLAALFYWIFPEYSTGFYTNYYRLVKLLLPVILMGSIPYFFLLDKYMAEPCDSYWHAGNVFLLRFSKVDKSIIKHHFLGWLVKVFFLALMFTYLMNNTNYLMNNDFSTAKNEFPLFYDYMYNLLYSIDLLFVTVGYLLTLKIFDSHIRTTEPTLFGWVVALHCYQPFWSMFSNSYIAYDDSYFWGNMLAGNYELYKIYGVIILLLITIYVLASVSFGVRFSNLTNRGIITNGPYRFMKHPAYLSKNLSWWLISVPFISMERADLAIKHCLLLIILNIVYYLRARTEERHLSLDPVYVEYGTAMNEKGIFRKLYKILPFLKYDVNNYIENGKIKKLYF